MFSKAGRKWGTESDCKHSDPERWWWLSEYRQSESIPSAIIPTTAGGDNRLDTLTSHYGQLRMEGACGQNGKQGKMDVYN